MPDLVVQHVDGRLQLLHASHQVRAPSAQELHARGRVPGLPQQCGELLKVPDAQPASRRQVTTPIQAMSPAEYCRWPLLALRMGPIKDSRS